MPRRAASALCATALALAVGVAAPAAGDRPLAKAGQAPGVRLVAIGNFEAPVYVTSPPADPSRLFVVEQAGRIQLLRDGRRAERPFLDIATDVTAGGEQGLLSVAFAPDYESSGLFYVYFTDRRGDQRVQEFRRSVADPDVADPRSRRQLMLQRDRFANHNGGQLQFGPDGLLYIGTGDGGGSGDPLGSGQRLSTVLGKVLRIDPRRAGGRPYSVPRSNPFARRRGARREIYAFGLRNPWRFSFDRRTGDLAIGDVGQNEVEEIDFRRRGKGRGANFGWSRFEGRRRFKPGPVRSHVPPVLQRFHSQGACSITGGYVVRDPALPGLAGRYLHGDFCDPDIRFARLGTRRASGDRSTGLRVEQLSSFGEDAAGRVYAVSLEGPVYRIAPG